MPKAPVKTFPNSQIIPSYWHGNRQLVKPMLAVSILSSPFNLVWPRWCLPWTKKTSGKVNCQSAAASRLSVPESVVLFTSDNESQQSWLIAHLSCMVEKHFGGLDYLSGEFSDTVSRKAICFFRAGGKKTEYANRQTVACGVKQADFIFLPISWAVHQTRSPSYLRIIINIFWRHTSSLFPPALPLV